MTSSERYSDMSLFFDDLNVLLKIKRYPFRY